MATYLEEETGDSCNQDSGTNGHADDSPIRGARWSTIPVDASTFFICLVADLARFLHAHPAFDTAPGTRVGAIVIASIVV